MKVKAKVKAKAIKSLECKGRSKPTKKGRSFCWRIRVDGKYENKAHRVQFVSTRTGNPVGFLSQGNGFTALQKEAQTWDYLNKFAAEYEVKRFIDDASSKSKHIWNSAARQAMKKLEKAAEE